MSSNQNQINNFFDSWMAKHPRRTREAYHNQYKDTKFIHDNPIPRNLSFEELWDWFGLLQEVERTKIK